MQALARRVCLEVQQEVISKPTVVVIDQTTLANLEAYDSFDKTAQYFVQEFEKIAPPTTPTVFLAGAGPDDFADTTAAVAAALAASTTESASTITIQDISADVKLSFLLANDPDCRRKQADVFYPGMYGEENTSLTGSFTKLVNDHESAISTVATSLCPPTTTTTTTGATITTPTATCANPAAIANSVKATAFNTLDASYNQFLQSWFATNSSTGQSGLSSVLQGYGLHKLLAAANRTIYEVFVNVAAAGGTQQDRKNLLTALITGDWIRYSGGIVVNTMIIKKTGPNPNPTVLYADVLRYRSPLTHIKKPIGKNSTHYGDNLGDTCPDTTGPCARALGNQ
jgi:hypothetical protein